MAQQREGRIVTIASIQAMATDGGAGSYVAAKDALVSFTKSLAVELAPQDYVAERGWRYCLRRWQANPTAFRIDGRTQSGLGWILISGNSGGYDRGWSVRLGLRFPAWAGSRTWPSSRATPTVTVPRSWGPPFHRKLSPVLRLTAEWPQGLSDSFGKPANCPVASPPRGFIDHLSDRFLRT